MSRASLLPPARKLALLAALSLVALGAVLATASPAQAAKPCWERVIDDWVDNGRIDGVYSASCMNAARKHVPEDIRAYTDIIDKIDSYRQTTGRTTQGSVGSPTGPEPRTTTTPPGTKEPEPTADPGREDGPIPYVLRKGTTDASSIPLPLMILAGLALALMAAGGVGVAHRKLVARKTRR